MKKTSFLLTLLLSFTLTVVIMQLINLNWHASEYLTCLNDTDAASDENTDEEDNSEPFFKSISFENFIISDSYNLSQLEARLKSFNSDQYLVFIQSIVGAIDAPPPEQA